MRIHECRNDGKEPPEPPCEFAVYDGMNMLCNFTGKKVYIHLVKTCPREEEKQP